MQVLPRLNNIVIACMLLGNLALCQRPAAQNARIESLTIEDGLSQGMVYDMLQTRDGFLWFATKDGLNRYDGYNFRVYSKSVRDSFSLSENITTTLLEDSRGLLWIGTENNGVNVLNRRTGLFHQINLNPIWSDNQLQPEIQAILETSDGAIWVSQVGNGLFRIQLPAEWPSAMPARANLAPFVQVTAFNLPQQPGMDKNTPIFIRKVKELAKDQFLISTQNGIYRFDAQTRVAEFVPVDMPRPRPGLDAVNNASALGPEEIWVTGDQSAVRIFQGQTTRLFFPEVSLYAGLSTDHAGNHWLVVEKKVWRLRRGEIPRPDKPDFVLEQDVASVMQDQNGNIWFGTRGYGLRKFNPQVELFQAGAAGHSINGLWEDAAGTVYAQKISTIYRYDPVGRLLDPGTAFPDAPNRQMDLAFEPGGGYWLLCGIKGVNDRSELRYYPAGGGAPQSYPFQHRVYPQARLFFDPRGYLWVTGWSGQLTRFDIKNRGFKDFDFSHLFQKNQYGVKVIALEKDARGALWLGTQYGLVEAAAQGEELRFRLFAPDAADPFSLSAELVKCRLPDPAAPDRILWVGTKGGGLDRLDISSGRFTHLTTEEGLPNDVVYGVLPDKLGQLWCSTNRGVVRLQIQNVIWPDAGQPGRQVQQIPTIVYTAAEGLQSTEFNTQAHFKAPGGALLFGGVNGINRFFPEKIEAGSRAPSVVLVGLSINHDELVPGARNYPFDRPLEYLSRIDLAYDQNNISFEFAALDFSDPSKNQYRYQLQGIEHNWIDAGSKHFAHYSHLPPGEYVFRVIGSNGHNIWNERPVELRVVIHPPWWRSYPAYLCYTLFLLWVLWKIYRFQINRVQLRAQLKFEQLETERIRAVEEMKSNFFANITHEFRTPLTLIRGPVQQILNHPEDPAREEKLRMVERNSSHLLDLVNHLLDLAKLESKSMTLDERLGDLANGVEALALNFKHLAEQKGILLECQADANIPAFLYDPTKVDTILNNLLSNALKFTPGGGKVRISVVPADNNGVRVEVSDTGIGIAPEAQKHIFDRFYQAPGNPPQAAGSGIGLALCQELSILMGGTLSVKSTPDKGSTFTLWLPVRRGGEKQAVVAAPLAAADSELPQALVIEDNADLREFIRHSIGRQWQVTEARNGDEGIALALDRIPDLVITDLMMPGKDGYTVVRTLKHNELTAHIPVILLTAKSATEARIEGLRAGADDYLTKPFNAEELLIRMENLVAIRQQLIRRFGQSAVDIPAADTEALAGPDREFMQRFSDVLEQHLENETLGVEEFAGKMYVSRVQLHRKMKALTGKPASDFIRDYRLERAMQMLQQRQGSVGEIATRVGFVNEKYFSTVFKEKFGVSPSQVDDVRRN
ncbi:MAG: response regulator [Saprospiraceae bacterium]|nr:response regulator [Saprospiraceae bacterium]